MIPHSYEALKYFSSAIWLVKNFNFELAQFAALMLKVIDVYCNRPIP
jgi:hypothetical protein